MFAHNEAHSFLAMLVENRVMACKRVENVEWGTVDFVDTQSPNGNIIFRTFPEVSKTLF